MYKLIIEDDEGKTTVVPLIRDEISIGRKEGNTIRLTERNVSRKHARLIRQNGAVYIEDLSSYNGIKVNGDRIQGKAAIGEGDSIQIGDYRLSVKLDRTEAKGPSQQPSQSEEPATRQFVKPEPAPVSASAQTVTTQAPVAAAVQSSVPTVPHQVLPMPVAMPAPAPEKPARLVVISSNFAGQEFLLDKAAVVIGRTDENDVVINHRSISRHHAKIVREGGHYHIVDLQSANGVRVNGEEYGKVELRKGDQIDLGHVRLVFVAAGQDFDIKGKIVDPENGGRSWVVVAILFLLVVGGAGLAYKLYFSKPGGGGPSEIEADAAKTLLEVEADLRNRHWTEAIEKIDRVLLITNLSQQTRETAVSKRDKADAERRAQATYDRFTTAAGGANYDEALGIYRELPAESTYRAMAKEMYDKIFPLFVEAHLKAAEAARIAGNCPEVGVQVQKVLDWVPEHIQAQALKGRPCPAEKVAMNTEEPRHTSRPSRQPRNTEKPAGPGEDPPVAVAEPDKPNDEEIDRILREAQTEYVNGNFAKAIDIAKPARVVPRAWRIIGAAACNLRELKLVNEAYRRIDDQGRQYVVYVCQRQGVVRVGTSNQFKLAD